MIKEFISKNLRDRGQVVSLTVGLAIGVIFFGSFVHRHYPIEHWLFWRYAAYWLAVAFWAAACFGFGSLLVERVFRLRVPLIEHALFAFTLGLLSFEWAMFLAGILQGYSTLGFFGVPLLLLVSGFDSLRRLLGKARRVLMRRPPPRSALRTLAIAFGFIGLLMVYFVVLTPENVQFDARWKHMALAEDYVAHGGIRRSDEGWIFAARPHITSYLYAWAFLLPGSLLFDRIELCAHLEYFTFLMTTLLGVSALVRRLAPRADPSMVWAARFLFPGVLLYDSSLSGGTDHFGALYAVPIGLALLRVWRSREARDLALLMTLLAGAVMVKETAALLLVPFPLLACVVRWGMDAVQHFRGKAPPEAARKLWLLPLVGLGVALAVSIPLWLKNLIWYGDPLYPSLARFFWPKPWSETAAYRFKWTYADRLMWSASRDWDGFVDTLKTLVSYSFDPNDWYRQHRNVPVFGSLFTLLLIPLPFLARTKRIWFVVLWVHLGIVAWYLVHHQDRYLQAAVPLMAAVVAAILILLWRSGSTVVRGWAGLLVGLQVVWGADVYFFQTHAMARSPIKKVVDLLSSGFEGKYEERFQVHSGFRAIGGRLPKGARLLIHEHHPHLGVGVETVMDSHQWQYGIEYGAQGTPEGVRKLLQRLGVTHIWYKAGRATGVPGLASDILFYEFVTHHATDPVSVGGGRLVTVPTQPSSAPFRGNVAALTCRELPTPGLYAIAAIDVIEYGPNQTAFGAPKRAAENAREAVSLLPEADFAVVEARCFRKGLPPELTDRFEVAVKRGKDPRQIWARIQAGAEAEKGTEPEEPASEETPE